MNDHENSPPPMFARRAVCDLGKATQEIKTKVDEQTEYEWLRLCAQQNMKSAEFLRDLVFMAVHGKSHSRMVAEQKLHDVESTEAFARMKGLYGAPEFREVRHG